MADCLEFTLSWTATIKNKNRIRRCLRITKNDLYQFLAQAQQDAMETERTFLAYVYHLKTQNTPEIVTEDQSPQWT